MSRSSKLFLFILRVAVGWFFLYQGLTTILDPKWSVLPYIQNPHTFPEFYTNLAHSALLPYITYLIKGLFILIGGLLVSGLFVRIAALLGAVIMLFFYFPSLQFPYVIHDAEKFYIVDHTLILVIALMYLFAARAGEVFGLGTMFKFSRY